MTRTRASDAEREQVAQVLRAAMTEGRLTLAEGEERLTQAYAATHRDELGPLLTDLPGEGWAAVHHTAEARTHRRRHVWAGVPCLVGIAAVLTGLWVLSGTNFFWPAIPLLIITFALLRRGRYRHRSGSRPQWMPR